MISILGLFILLIIPIDAHEEQKVFTCDSGTLTLPSTYINDNYCDCIDGSDETKTSACRDTIYICPNIGYQEKQIPTSRIHDGYCDCCDGSDETIQDHIYEHIICPNTCADEWNITSNNIETTIQIYEKGIETQIQALKYIPDITKYIESRLQVNEHEHKMYQQQYQQELAATRAANLREPPASLTQAENNLRNTISSIQSLRSIYDTVINTNNKQKQQKQKKNKEQIKQVQLHVAQVGQQTNHWLALITKQAQCQQYIWQIKKYGAFGPSLDEYRMELCPLMSATQWQHTSDPVEAAKISSLQSWKLGHWDGKIHVQQHKKQQQKQGKKGDTKNDDLQKRKEALKGKNQTAKKRKAVTVEQDATPQAPVFIMNYVDGEQCWNGPQRSAQVIHQCGQHTKITQVRENGRCSYEFTMTTPLACDPRHLQLLRQYQQQLIQHREHKQQQQQQQQPSTGNSGSRTATSTYGYHTHDEL